ncbi:hypothetical protein SAMN05421841_3535 [Chryseobacterium wanjuense]|uniref:Uncharacterized protein n=1 Tax=Chryseobacterium wanjuense TaxID=356305 RepID=A0A1I0S029_9FLAO|nr:hypothetical protein SAMN05421841_3535 [Chryseobacterium wanjuense]
MCKDKKFGVIKSGKAQKGILNAKVCLSEYRLMV